jgi:hypothetical protein
LVCGGGLIIKKIGDKHKPLYFLPILFLLTCFALFSFCLLVNALQFYIFACFAIKKNLCLLINVLHHS